ncbi:hypothetical protein RBSH_00992 [Rhodopirellula baltica SH28]|uniref:Uncharacterized protein n=1 Tax=Rhodopirellula baltica SH28 TaxID=993517 RepID=K5DM45_RHOBT|nr:hypothetical protein RBSH_00992 [Rhodopirellula baltica SH28]
MKTPTGNQIERQCASVVCSLLFKMIIAVDEPPRQSRTFTSLRRIAIT